MERKRITCPETAHLEEIDFDRTPCGIVITGCSRFEPRSAIECECECARRMDRRERRELEDRAERVLVFVDEDESTRSIAKVIASDLVRDGLVVELADGDDRLAPPPADYEAVVIGSPVRSGRLAHGIVEYIVHHRDALAAMPAFFFAVGEGGGQAWLGDEISRRTGWHPTLSMAFTGPALGSKRRWIGWRSRTQPERPLENADRVHDFAIKIADEIPGLAEL